MAWQSESERHSMARNGVHTKQNEITPPKKLQLTVGGTKFIVEPLSTISSEVFDIKRETYFKVKRAYKIDQFRYIIAIATYHPEDSKLRLYKINLVSKKDGGYSITNLDAVYGIDQLDDWFYANLKPAEGV